MKTLRVLRVAVPSPLHGYFDYLPPDGGSQPQPGMRVRVPFGRRRLVGLIVAVDEESRIEQGRLRPALALLDDAPLLGPELMGLLSWTAEYYRHPPGEVFASALPALLRRGERAVASGIERWSTTEAGQRQGAEGLEARAPRQASLLRTLQGQEAGLTSTQLRDAHGPDWRKTARALADKGLAVAREEPCLPPADCQRQPGPRLNTAQEAAVATVRGHLGRFAPTLLEGVTGSGKTEVYIRLIEEVVDRAEQALVLVPEIALTPQLVARFAERLALPLAVLHSGLSDRERLCAWLLARSGEAPVVLGTRSAVFAPLAHPGLVIVDEEHDLSLKQQEGLRYHARDVAVMRARRVGMPVLLGTATPSLESLYNVARGSYQRLALPERAGNASHPGLHIVDARRCAMVEGIAQPLLERISDHLDRGGQVLLFLNRRGYAPVLLCHDCGWSAECQRCDAHMTYHERAGQLRCHHCGADRMVPRACPGCGSPDLRAIGQGTQRMETRLAEAFPDAGVTRIDRDSTRAKGAFEAKLEAVHSGQHRILVGTQMLAKGHHFPAVTLVGVLDADQGLFSADFRAAERMAQLIVQVAGRAGREDRAGEVIIQSHHPDHPLLQTLVRHGYPAFARTALAERELAGLPPYRSMALLRAEAVSEAAPNRFLERVSQIWQDVATPGVTLMGPAPAPMERRAGRYRSHLMVYADRRPALQRLLASTVPELSRLPEARRVRWSVDVDPMEIL